MTQLSVGDKAPAFGLSDQHGDTVRLSSFKGAPVIVYFLDRPLLRMSNADLAAAADREHAPVEAGAAARGQEAMALPCHVGNKEACQTAVNSIIQKWGGIDILVCNAASNPHFGPLATASDDVFDKIMETNVKSVFWLGNMVIPRMAEQGGGAMVIIKEK